MTEPTRIPLEPAVQGASGAGGNTPTDPLPRPVNLPEGSHLAYSVMHEAWYAKVPSTFPIVERPQLNIAASVPAGGVKWEFTIAEYDLHGKCLRLDMFGEAWQAMAQMPTFFEWLAEEGDNVTLDDVRMVLDSLGAVDDTVRVQPAPARPVTSYDPAAISAVTSADIGDKEDRVQ